MLKRTFVVFQLFTLSIFCTSCWNARELNELSIAMALGIDKAEDNKYEISIQVVLPQEISEPSYNTPVKLYSVKENSIFEAFRKMTTILPRKIYLPHFRVMVIGEELAKEGIADILEMLIRDHEFRSDFFIVVTKGGYSAKEILQVMTPFEKIPSQEIYSILETSEKVWAPTSGVKLDKLVNNIKSEGKEAVLTGVTIKENGTGDKNSIENNERIEPYALLELKSIAVFKEDKLIGWLNEEQSKGLNYLRDQVRSTVGPIDCPREGRLIIEIKEAHTKLNTVLKDNRPEIKIESYLKANIGEVMCNIDLAKPETIQELEKNIEKHYKELIDNTIKVIQEDFNSDILGFGEKIHKSYPEIWKQLNENWDEEFKQIPVSYNIIPEINYTGTIQNPLFNKELGEED